MLAANGEDESPTADTALGGRQPDPAAGAVDRDERALGLGLNWRQSGWVTSIQTLRMAKPTCTVARAAIAIWRDVKDNVVRAVGITAHTSHSFQMIQS